MADKIYTQEELDKIVAQKADASFKAGFEKASQDVEKLKKELEDAKVKLEEFGKEKSLREKEEFLSKNGVDVEQFKEFKSFDEFTKLEDEKDKLEFIKKLKENKPNLFKEESEKEETYDEEDGQIPTFETDIFTDKKLNKKPEQDKSRKEDEEISNNISLALGSQG